MQPLTARQLQVARLIADGYSNSEIAEKLWIAERTVKAHCETIKLKLGVERKAQIGKALREKGYVD